MTTRHLIATATVVCALAIPVAAQAASSAAYPPAVVATYTKSCKAQAKIAAEGKVSAKRIAAYCGCALRYIETRLTYPEFKAAGRAVVTLSGGTAKAKAALRGAIRTCAPRLEP